MVSYLPRDIVSCVVIAILVSNNVVTETPWEFDAIFFKPIYGTHNTIQSRIIIWKI